MDTNEEDNPNPPPSGDKMDIETQETAAEPEPSASTPRRRGRPPKAKPKGSTPTTSKPNVVPVFATPTKAVGFNALTPGRAADRSARRKSARALIDRVVGDGGSDDDDQAGDDIARQIYESSDAGDEDDGEDELDERTDGEGASSAPGEAATPSKTPARRKPRPKRARSPTPPRDLPPHELYFLHNKPGRPKTSDNTLASLSLLSHDEYFGILREHQDRHADNVESLESLHAESFPQWAFELSRGFSICLYGLGSKRHLLRKFATYIHANGKSSKAGKMVIVNGYAHTANIREILGVVASAVDPTQRVPTAQPTVMVQSIASRLSSTKLTITIIINSIDAVPLRKPGSQAILAQLAAHPQISLMCSADTPDFPLLWDIGVRSDFNFVFHDCTTFSPFKVELDVVDDVHELLGRQSQRVNGREGVAFVLKSLTENAKSLFRLLVGEVLVAMEDEGDDGVGLEYRMVYNKAVEEFICSSEMAFRTLLKEFHDHQMLTSRKDNLGTELLSLPFRKEDLEAILEDLTA
ncbi:origin recognition complex subunit 2 [Trichoderma cornu-damae]|uniref:Origin recognition complex subunit 2 n=1 Tax=Trichoderma cornu-damae TaxID=654480 RepID=A0A9P8TZT8_9HYPO|nr:origin recognition complex subunit 2 [Trichoderma cornu-damae]